MLPGQHYGSKKFSLLLTQKSPKSGDNSFELRADYRQLRRKLPPFRVGAEKLAGGKNPISTKEKSF